MLFGMEEGKERRSEEEDEKGERKGRKAAEVSSSRLTRWRNQIINNTGIRGYGDTGIRGYSYGNTTRGCCPTSIS